MAEGKGSGKKYDAGMWTPPTSENLTQGKEGYKSNPQRLKSYIQKTGAMFSAECHVVVADTKSFRAHMSAAAEISSRLQARKKNEEWRISTEHNLPCAKEIKNRDAKLQKMAEEVRPDFNINRSVIKTTTKAFDSKKRGADETRQKIKDKSQERSDFYVPCSKNLDGEDWHLLRNNQVYGSKEIGRSDNRLKLLAKAANIGSGNRYAQCEEGSKKLNIVNQVPMHNGRTESKKRVLDKENTDPSARSAKTQVARVLVRKNGGRGLQQLKSSNISR